MGKAEERDWLAEFGLREKSLRMTVSGDLFFADRYFFAFRPEKPSQKALRKIGGMILTLISGGATDDNFHEKRY